MRKNRPAPKRILLDRCDVPPALIGDPDVDTRRGSRSCGRTRTVARQRRQGRREHDRRRGMSALVLQSGINVSPDASGLPGSSALVSLLGGLQFDAELAAIAAVIIGAAVWALSSHANNYQGASRGRTASSSRHSPPS